MKLYSIASVLFFAIASQVYAEELPRESSIPQVADFLRDNNGKALEGFSPEQAALVCEKNLGSRLPTIRELAVDSVKHGAAVIEVKEYDKIPSNYIKRHFYLIQTGTDSFYYAGDPYKWWSKPNYRHPVDQGYGYFSDTWVWSSSRSLHGRAYYIDSYDGAIHSWDRTLSYNFYGVRCVPPQ